MQFKTFLIQSLDDYGEAGSVYICTLITALHSVVTAADSWSCFSVSELIQVAGVGMVE